MSFKNNLKNELEYQNIQLKEFSGKIGIPYGTLLTYVNSREHIPRMDIGYKIAKELNVSMEYLITGRNEDNYIKFSPYFKELIQLPIPLVKAFEKIIHSYHELYKNKGV